MELFDENEAIKRMRHAIPEEIASTLDDDEFINILDMMMDWMEDNNLCDVDAGEDDIDNDRKAMLDNLVPYVKKLLSKDKGATFPLDLVENVVIAELEYEDEISQL